jgi:hypothetical protein
MNVKIVIFLSIAIVGLIIELCPLKRNYHELYFLDCYFLIMVKCYFIIIRHLLFKFHCQI